MGFKANELHTSNNMSSLIMGEKLVEKRFPLSKEKHQLFWCKLTGQLK